MKKISPAEMTRKLMKNNKSILLAALGAVCLAIAAGAHAQSIGVSFTSDGNDSGVGGINDNAERQTQ